MNAHATEDTWELKIESCHDTASGAIGTTTRCCCGMRWWYWHHGDSWFFNLFGLF